MHKASVTVAQILTNYLLPYITEFILLPKGQAGGGGGGEGGGGEQRTLIFATQRER